MWQKCTKIAPLVCGVFCPVHCGKALTKMKMTGSTKEAALAEVAGDGAKGRPHLRQTMAMTTRAMTKTRPAVTEPTIRGSCSCKDFSGSPEVAVNGERGLGHAYVM